MSETEPLSNTVAAIAERDLDPRVAFMLNRELRRLGSELRNSERLVCLAMTKSPYLATGVFALTDERVVYVRKPLLGRKFRTKSIRLEDVMTIETRMNLDVLTIFVPIYRDGRQRFSFTPEAKNREQIAALLRSLPHERHARLRRGLLSTGAGESSRAPT
jgi:hypothetical protein